MKVYEINYDVWIYGSGECNASRYIRAENREKAIKIALRTLRISRKEIIFCRAIPTIN